MKTLAYFDCFSGISGNMALGALLDCGIAPDAFRAELKKLSVGGYRFDLQETTKAGFRGLLAEIRVEEKQPHRHLKDIEEIIQRSALAERVRGRSLETFRRLAQAESKVHGEPVEKVHFHEVGAVDAIVDIVGTAICLELLGVEKVYASPLHIGAGSVQSAHGRLPVPAPATAELLQGVPVYGRDVDAELVTPTGAALLRGLEADFGEAPPMHVERTGSGAGTRDLPWANLLRVTVGSSVEERENGERGPALAQRELVVEANIDDMNPQWYEHVMERLFQAGALDVFLAPIQMKRNRPAVILSLIVGESELDAALGVLFSETTTIGVRMHPVERRKLEREERTVQTAYGPVKIKTALWRGRVMNTAPEYRDCLRLAEEKGVPLKEIWLAAVAAARSVE